jgi:hypothetical protein
MRNIKISFAILIICCFLLGFFSTRLIKKGDVICDPIKVTELHATENIYPAWRYECASGEFVVILD